MESSCCSTESELLHDKRVLLSSRLLLESFLGSQTPEDCYAPSSLLGIDIDDASLDCLGLKQQVALVAATSLIAEDQLDERAFTVIEALMNAQAGGCSKQQILKQEELLLGVRREAVLCILRPFNKGDHIPATVLTEFAHRLRNFFPPAEDEGACATSPNPPLANVKAELLGILKAERVEEAAAALLEKCSRDNLIKDLTTFLQKCRGRRTKPLLEVAFDRIQERRLLLSSTPTRLPYTPEVQAATRASPPKVQTVQQHAELSPPQTEPVSAWPAASPTQTAQVTTAERCYQSEGRYHLDDDQVLSAGLPGQDLGISAASPDGDLPHELRGSLPSARTSLGPLLDATWASGAGGGGDVRLMGTDDPAGPDQEDPSSGRVPGGAVADGARSVEAGAAGEADEARRKQDGEGELPCGLGARLKDLEARLKEMHPGEENGYLHSGGAFGQEGRGGGDHEHGGRGEESDKPGSGEPRKGGVRERSVGDAKAIAESDEGTESRSTRLEPSESPEDTTDADYVGSDDSEKDEEEDEEVEEGEDEDGDEEEEDEALEAADGGPSKSGVAEYGEGEEEEEEGEEEEEEDPNDDRCKVCDLPGKLLCCETCPAAYHLGCVGLEDTPEGLWSCKDCTEADLENERSGPTGAASDADGSHLDVPYPKGQDPGGGPTNGSQESEPPLDNRGWKSGGGAERRPKSRSKTTANKNGGHRRAQHKKGRGIPDSGAAHGNQRASEKGQGPSAPDIGVYEFRASGESQGEEEDGRVGSPSPPPVGTTANPVGPTGRMEASEPLGPSSTPVPAAAYAKRRFTCRVCEQLQPDGSEFDVCAGGCSEELMHERCAEYFPACDWGGLEGLYCPECAGKERQVRRAGWKRRRDQSACGVQDGGRHESPAPEENRGLQPGQKKQRMEPDPAAALRNPAEPARDCPGHCGDRPDPVLQPHGVPSPEPGGATGSGRTASRPRARTGESDFVGRSKDGFAELRKTPPLDHLPRGVPKPDKQKEHTPAERARWTEDEENALEEGYAQCGNYPNRWQAILKWGAQRFHPKRKSEHLKDKWRQKQGQGNRRRKKP